MQNQSNICVGDRVEIGESIKKEFTGLLPRAASKGTVETIKTVHCVQIALVHFDGCAIYKVPLNFLVKLEGEPES